MTYAEQEKRRRWLNRKIEHARDYLDAHPDASTVNDQIGEWLSELYDLDVIMKGGKLHRAAS